MGFCATPTPTMGKFSTEVRSRSIVVRGAGFVKGAEPETQPDLIYLEPDTVNERVGSFEIDTSSLDALIETLQQAQRIARDGVAYEWANASGEPIEVQPALFETEIPTDLLVRSIVEGSDTATRWMRASADTPLSVGYASNLSAAFDAEENLGDATAEIAKIVAAGIAAANESWVKEQTKRLRQR